MPRLDRLYLQGRLLNLLLRQLSMVPFGCCGANMVHPEGNGQCGRDRPGGCSNFHRDSGNAEGDHSGDRIILSFQRLEGSRRERHACSGPFKCRILTTPVIFRFCQCGVEPWASWTEASAATYFHVMRGILTPPPR